ncbi:ribonuclease [Rhizobium grahamii]|uniref:Ribonuclease n=1 Tax=Rhizobium grahamii TaxID=1120045 RepID=A0A5Q0CAH2_9HYPH|nr:MULTISPECIES: ribonuclease [Rhizobium]QFY60679.1 ribonuclease [Rhizobium grahamii]QRM50184.1 ribonuclease [Rhizobium sp. BG6]
MRGLVKHLFVLTISAAVASGAMAQQMGGKTRFILAASWQPSFCETNQRKAECRNQTKERFDATNFSLHGLWPMRQNYCDVKESLRTADKDGDWNELPEVSLSDASKAALDKAMPGTQSGLERHEWLKHGTCTGLSADAYFSTAVRLVGELNASAVRDLFAANIGKSVTAEQIKEAFDKSFGPGASDRVKMSCHRAGQNRVISELTIGLSEEATGDEKKSLGDLIQGAGRTSFGCNEGIVDAAGF